jgi:outer membrane lipoprotein carrier protein
MGMKSLFIFLSVALSFATADALPVSAVKPDLKKTIEKIQANLDKISNFSASFSQVYRESKTRLESKSEGVVKFKKPGLMRWDYTNPSKKSFIVDGKSLWIYQPADKQVMFDHCFKQDTLTASLSFLWGGGNIQKQFESEYFKKQFGEDESDLNIQLTPKAKSNYFKKLILVIDAKTYEVKQSVVIDLTGNANQFKFTDVKKSEIENAVFKFERSKAIQELPIVGSDPNCKIKE